MEKQNNLTQFDYSKYGEEISWGMLSQQDHAFWGLHDIDGKLHIDIERYKYVCKEVGITDFIPSSWENTQEKVFIPQKQDKYDYTVNVFRNLIGKFTGDWFSEYKPLLNKIRTPEQVRENVRTERLMYTSCSDDFDSIDEDAMFAMVRRIPKYNDIIQSLYCSFIAKFSTEIDRITLIVISELGYKGKDFSVDSFLKFSDGLQKDKSGIKIEKLKKYNAYNLLHKINNFLKHNSIEAYKKLKRFYPDNVRSIEQGTADREYENGMFAGDWIIVKENYIDSLLDELIEFFEDYCVHYLNENIDEARWNYKNYFYDAVRQMSDPMEYIGANDL